MIKINGNELNYYKIKEYLENGLVSIVNKPDWSVNRICPSFIELEFLKKNIFKDNIILHLGMGNGTCYKYFAPGQQYSISDKIYYDPLEIIFLFFEINEIAKPSYAFEFYAPFLRNKFLIAINLDYFLKFNKRELFDEIDNNIFELYSSLKKSLPTFSEQFIILKTLIIFLNDLLEGYFVKGAMREVTPFGKKINVIDNIVVHNSNIVFKGNKLTLEVVIKFLLNKFSEINNIFIENYSNLDITKFNNKFNYILANRSDAFLNQKYWEFLHKVLKMLPEDGIYISDGVVSSYSYCFFYKEYLKFCEYKDVEKSSINFLFNMKREYDVPLNSLCGIIYINKKKSPEKNFPYIKPDVKIVSAIDVEMQMCFIEQCAWTDLIEYLGAHKFRLEDLTNAKIKLLLKEIILDKHNNPFEESLNIERIVNRYL